MPPASPGAQLNKAAFFESLGYRPHAGQVGVHESRAHRRILACGVRWGKTVCAAAEGMAAGMEPGERKFGWVVAPTYDLADKVYRELVFFAHEKIPHRVVLQRTSDRVLKIRNLSGGVCEIRAKSGDNPTSLLGEGLDWLIVDEAARLKPTVWDAHLSQRLIDKKGWALLISTPKGKGWFYQLYRRGQQGIAGHESWNRPSWSNPHLDAELIQSQRALIPERVFRQEYGAEFIEGAGSVFRNVQDMATGGFQDPIPGRIYKAGLDLARVEDYTVLTIVDEDGRVVFLDRFTRLDWTIQLLRIAAGLKRYNDAQVNVDSTGAGHPIYESMREAGMDALPYQFTQSSKAALVDNLALMCEQMLLELPPQAECEVLLEEMEAFEYSVTDSGNVRSGAPSGIHDDCVISLALSAWLVRPNRLGAYCETPFF